MAAPHTAFRNILFLYWESLRIRVEEERSHQQGERGPSDVQGPREPELVPSWKLLGQRIDPIHHQADLISIPLYEDLRGFRKT